MDKDNAFQLKGFVVWGICALFFLYEFFLRTVIGAYQHPLMQDLNLTSFQFSLLSSTLFLLIYGLMQIPVGLIVDNIGLKHSLTIGSIICTISSIGFAYSHNYYIAIFFRMLMGLGASFGFICLLIAVHDWMPRRYSGIFIGLSQFIGTLGPMMSAGPLETLSQSNNIDWRFIFVILGVIGGVISLLILLFVKNNQQKSGKHIILNRPEKIRTSIARLFYKIQPWYIAILSATLYFTVEYLSENEGRNFMSLKGLSLTSGSYMITTAWIGFAVGAPLLGGLSDFFQRRKNVVILGSILGILSVTIIVYSVNQILLAIAFFLLGLSASAQSICFAMMAEQFKKQFVAVGFGLNNAIIMIISALNAPFIAMLLDRNKQGAFITHDEYVSVFNILIVIALISVVVSIFYIKETYCKSSADFTYLKPVKKVH